MPQCKSPKCQAEITFWKNPKTGSFVPLDKEPVLMLEGEGREMGVDLATGKIIRGRVVEADAEVPASKTGEPHKLTGVHLMHHQTCKDVSRFKK